MTSYRSAIGVVLVVPLAVLLGGMIFLFAFHKIWAVAAIVAATAGFVVYTLASTSYTIHGTTLHIRSGLFYDLRIDIRAIHSVVPMRNAMSSPAASLERIEIRYNATERVLISPQARHEFLRHLLSINPGIVLDPKL